MKRLKHLVIGGLATIAVAVGVTPAAHADSFGVPGYGCETIGHPVLLSWIEKRTICDSPRYADGHWDRTRIFWIPAHSTAAESWCGDYSCSYTPAQSYADTVVGKETYPVNDGDLLPDEPGWLPTGTANIK